jgi:hypothetical protein
VQSRGCRAIKWELLEELKFTMHFLDLKDWDWDSPIWLEVRGCFLKWQTHIFTSIVSFFFE